MINPIKLERGGIYVIQLEVHLEDKQLDALIGYLDVKEKDFGVHFIVLHPGLKIACGISAEGMTLDEIKLLIEELKR